MAHELKAICVFCGSNGGRNPVYIESAVQTGRLLASHGIRLIYGGGHVGMMGTIADAVLASGGEVTGVIPQALADRELAHEGVTELHVVDSMHETKSPDGRSFRCLHCFAWRLRNVRRNL